MDTADTCYTIDPVLAARDALIGRAALVQTPFGRRPLVYADYAASGRGDARVDARLARVTAQYANPHTDDSATGRAATAALHEAERLIRAAINADPDDVVLGCGSGATGAVAKLQEILGVAEPPAARAARREALAEVLGRETADSLEAELQARAPVVFIGPYEHHSNDLIWREANVHCVRIGLDETGGIDFAMLEAALADPAYAQRRKIGAFSAASNVTGLRTDTARLAKLLHAHGAILCLDCAASAPYLPIELNPDDPAAAPDAVYFSPHKLIGGPGACGVLAFKAALYSRALPPTVPGGGTVSYVTPDGHDYLTDIAARERAGTPGVMQMLRAGLALQTLSEVGYDQIDAREHAALVRAFSAWSGNPSIDVLGPGDPARRIGIVAFNIRVSETEILHPRLTATLLNDLFGIQARAGCSCAGPYGHHLLALSEADSQGYRHLVRSGLAGLRPGWCRLSLHWIMTPEEVGYLIEAVEFLAAYGRRFVPLYAFDVRTGAWRHRGADRDDDAVLEAQGVDVDALRAEALAQAWHLAAALPDPKPVGRLPETIEPFRRFPVPA